MAKKVLVNPGAGKGLDKYTIRKILIEKALVLSKKTRYYKIDIIIVTINFKIKKVYKVSNKIRYTKLDSKLIKSINLIINLIITLAAALRQIRFF